MGLVQISGTTMLIRKLRLVNISRLWEGSGEVCRGGGDIWFSDQNIDTWLNYIGLRTILYIYPIDNTQRELGHCIRHRRRLHSIADNFFS
jgi:hypothetical protein